MNQILVDRIGVEIEGGWDEKPLNFHGDGSVSGSKARYYGEIISKPLKNPELIKTWVKDNYPEHTNRTCGFHIHLSFKNQEDYEKLMTKKFYITFLESAREWGVQNEINEGSAFWNRLDGENNWCKSLINQKGLFLKTTIKQQFTAYGKSGPRYYHLNFCKNAHGTVECRLFPAFQKEELAERAVDFFYNLCNNYVAKVKTKSRKQSTKASKVNPENDTRFRDLQLIRSNGLRDGFGWSHSASCSCDFNYELQPTEVCEDCNNISVRVFPSGQNNTAGFEPFSERRESQTRF